MSRYKKIVEHLRSKAEIFKKSNYAVDGVVKCFEESADTIEQLAEELKQYKDKEEQGLLIELPCKVGSKVYLICARRTKCTEHGLEFDDYFCEGCECLECDSKREYYIHENDSVSLEWIVRYLKDFGVRVFLTRSEAEEALAKMGGK